MKRPAQEPEHNAHTWVQLEVLSEQEAARRLAAERPARARASVRNEVRAAIMRESPSPFREHRARFARLVQQARNTLLYERMEAAGAEARRTAAPVVEPQTMDELRLGCVFP